MKTIALAALLAATSAHAAGAAEWLHASAPMGQFEGQLRISDQNYVAYGCGIGSRVSFSMEGDQAGPVVVTIDGEPVRFGEIEHQPEYGASVLSFAVELDDKKSELYGFNYLVHSMAEGSEVALVRGEDTIASWTLAGSRDITNCAIFIGQ